MRIALPLLGLLLIVSCSQPKEDVPGPVADEPDFHPRLQEIAKEYNAWGRVDDETRWAPYLCRMPMASRARFSQSDHSTTHGRKLYFLFAKDRHAYISLKPQADGQVIVKESWKPKETSEAETTHGDVPTGSYTPYARKDGKLYHASEKGALFIMYKTTESTPGTDKGWVYGTVTVDGRVTSAGRVESCMSCHTEARYGRLFGLGK